MTPLELSKAGGRLLHIDVDVRDAGGAGIADATVTVQLHRANGDKFDFDDQTFKSTGWTEDDLDVPYVAGATYSIAPSIEQAGGDVDMSDGDVLRLEGTVEFSGGLILPLETVRYRCEQTLVAGAAGSGATEIDRATSELVVFAVDGTTELARMSLTDYADSNLAGTGTAGIPEKRGAPV